MGYLAISYFSSYTQKYVEETKGTNLHRRSILVPLFLLYYEPMLSLLHVCWPCDSFQVLVALLRY